MLASRFIAVVERQHAPVQVSPRERRCAVEAALWLEAHAAEEVHLDIYRTSNWAQPLSFPAALCAGAGRDAPSIFDRMPSQPCGATTCQ